MTTLQSKLQHHLAAKNAEWTSGERATWSDVDGKHVLVVGSPLTASLVVDAVVLALENDARATVAFDGAVSDVARRTALRFGVALLDGAALAEPPAPAQVLSPTLPLLPPHVEAPEPQPEPLTVPALPWSIEPSVAPAEASVTIHVEPQEILAMPWNRPGAPVYEHEEPDVVVTQRRPAGVAHATQLPNWGLPWPRPLPAADAIAIADPKIWGSAERVHAMRESLDAKGGGSFGALRADGSAWLRRVQDPR